MQINEIPLADRIDDAVDAYVLAPIAWTLRLAGLLALFAVGAVIGIAILAALCRFVVWAL